MMKRIISILKWFLPAVFLAAIGGKLVAYSHEQEKQFLQGYQTYEAATAALVVGDSKTAYVLFLQSSYELADPKLKAKALYEAANTGWVGGLADYHTLVALYKQSLRYDPGFYEAAFNLEYLYWLKTNSPEEIPQPEPGPEPGREEKIPNGDV